MQNQFVSKGVVEVIRLPGKLSYPLKQVLADPDPRPLEHFLKENRQLDHTQHNLVFNYPRLQYARMDRGETPEPVNANWLTLSNEAYLNPAIQNVSGETFRIFATTRIADPVNPRNSIIRFVLDVGQFTGSWKTAILIGGTGASSVPGSGYIIAAVNNVKDDANTPLNRDGTTIHLVNWKIKHLDSSEA